MYLITVRARYIYIELRFTKYDKSGALYVTAVTANNRNTVPYCSGDIIGLVGRRDCQLSRNTQVGNEMSRARISFRVQNLWQELPHERKMLQLPFTSLPTL